MKFLDLFKEFDSSSTSATTQPSTGMPSGTPDPQAAAKAAAAAMKQMADKKKELQDQIKSKEQELISLRKELASLSNPASVS